MSKLTEINKHVKNVLSDVALEKEVAAHLVSMVSTIYKQSMTSNDGYCYRFNLPIVGVQKLYSMLNLSVEDVSKAFQESWKYPPGTKMYSEPYYHILLLLVYYGIKENNELIASKSLFLVLVRIWKGRKTYYLKYCDPAIMRYIINNMMGKRNLLTKYPTPTILLHDYFVPTLLEKYSAEIIKSEDKLKNIFMQAYSRIGQLFGYNANPNSPEGKVEYQSGILPLYIKAKEGGMKSEVNTKSTETLDNLSSNFREDLAKKVSNQIVLNQHYKYPENFITAINKKTKVSSKRIQQLLECLHQFKYHEIIYDLIVLILSRTQIHEPGDLKSKDFLDKVERNIISSKNNLEIQKMTELLDMLLASMFKDDLQEGTLFIKYSNVQRAQIRNVIIYGIVYNLLK